MNFTSGNKTVTPAVNYRDSFVIAVGKNVIVVVLGMTINYINATMIHTFNRHHVCKLVLFLIKKQKLPMCFLSIHYLISQQLLVGCSSWFKVSKSYCVESIFVSCFKFSHFCCLLLLMCGITNAIS